MKSPPWPPRDPASEPRSELGAAERTRARVVGLPPPGDGRQDTSFAPQILPPDGDMSAYLRSLDKLRSLEFDRIAPGHGGVMGRGKEILASLLAHRLDREAKVLRHLRRLSAATLEDLTAAVYDDVAVERHGWARLTLEAHLIKLRPP